MNTNKLELYEARMKRLNDTVELKIPDRVPIFSIIDNWALGYYGTTLKKALSDVEIEYAAYSKATTDVYFDAIAFAGVTMPINFCSSLGGGMYRGDMETIQIATGQSQLMQADEYDELIADPKSFILNKILPRKLDIFKEGTTEEKFEKTKNSVYQLLQWFQDRAQLFERFKNEHGMPCTNAVPPFVAGDIILDTLRDFVGTMMDVRRHGDKMAEACMAMTQKYIIPSAYATMPQPLYDKYLNLFLHLPPYLKPKDFEKVYWPSFKLYIETFASQGYKFLILFEKNYEHLYDYLQELPAGSILGLFEEDDLRKTKKALGNNICIGGGISTNDLAYKTTEECLDIAKRAIDELAPGGGYVFCVDKVMNSFNDAKPENIIAVNNFVCEYGVYK